MGWDDDDGGIVVVGTVAARGARDRPKRVAADRGCHATGGRRTDRQRLPLELSAGRRWTRPDSRSVCRGVCGQDAPNPQTLGVRCPLTQ